jgi:hypothetical protein
MAAKPKTPVKPAEAPRGKANLPVNYAAQLAAEAADIAKQIAAPGGDRIRYNGNASFKTPDGMEGEAIEAVIVNFVSTNLFYDSPYDKGNPNPAACFAINAEPKQLIPSPNSPNKQADNCAVCPQNQFGSSGKGKACSNTRLLAVIASTAIDDPSNVADIWVMSVPPTSIKFFDAYVASLSAKQKTIPVGVITTIYLDNKNTYASPRFEVVRPLTDNELGVFMSRREEAMTRLLAEPDTSGYVAPKAVNNRAVPPRGARRV